MASAEYFSGVGIPGIPPLQGVAEVFVFLGFDAA
jgi:hypothetical protein